MPTIAFQSRIRTVSDNWALNLIVRHRLVAGEPSEALQIMKSPPPSAVDIISVSPLTITISATLNGTRIPLEQLILSRIAQHLPEYLRANSGELGLDFVSDVCIKEDTGLLTFFCTASRSSRLMDDQPPRLKLLGFDMEYIWNDSPPLKISQTSSHSAAVSPFSRQLPLPYLKTVNNVVGRFVTFQLVKRYPRIFGSWCKQLDVEQKFISSLFSSLRNISKRSTNLTFQQLFEKHLRTLKQTMSSGISSAESALSEYVGSMNDLQSQEVSRIDDGAAFVHAMERIYCLARKKQRFKGVSSHGPKAPESDEDFCDELIQLHTSVDFDEGPYLWTPPNHDRHSAPRKSLLLDYSDDQTLFSDVEQGVNILSDTSWDDAYHLSPSCHDMEDIINDFDDDKADGTLGSSFPERASAMADLVLEADIPSDPCSDNESLYCFDGECSPIVISSHNPRRMSLDLPESSDHFDIFETELSLPPPSALLPNSSMGEMTTDLFGVSDTFYDDLLMDDICYQGQTVSLSSETDISAQPRRRSASQGISRFDFTLDNLGHQTTRQVPLSGAEGVSGVISAKQPCNFYSPDGANLRMSELYVRSASVCDILGLLPSPCNGPVTPSSVGQDFVVIDF